MNWPVSRVPQCACWVTCSAPSGAEVCTFLFWMVHCGMPGRCAVELVRLVYHYYCLTDLSKLLCGTYDVEICFMLYLYIYVFMLYLCHVTVLWNAYLFGPKWSINYYFYYLSLITNHVARDQRLFQPLNRNSRFLHSFQTTDHLSAISILKWCHHFSFVALSFCCLARVASA